MNEVEFRKEYLEVWIPSQRYTELCDKLEEYKEDTENMIEPYATTHYRLLKSWCKDRGYTQREINTARNSMRF
tara:strand:+ start:73 stop:291 length:219 start_codon:yes stop_codon:yes gene_type:complete